jgi:hypothetical protein
MDHLTATRTNIMYPTGIEAPIINIDKEYSETLPQWMDSVLNPKNRVDSYTPVQDPTWRMDGAEADGARFFTIPNFALGKAPLRIDTCIPKPGKTHEPTSNILWPPSTMSVRSCLVKSLEISQYILRALESWSSQQSDLEKLYMSMPFGSRIVLGNTGGDIKRLNVQLIPVYDIEQQWLSVKTLQAMWTLSPTSWPDIIDIDDLGFIYQLHEAISLVHLVGKDPSRIFVFKSVLRELPYFYHELKILLTIEPHRNIISRPLFLVTKKCRFGGKVGLCGFILEYYPMGNLQDTLSWSSGSPLPSFHDQLRWAEQLTSALIHIHSSPIGFYANLKLINVVIDPSLGTSGSNAILIDFEQRSACFSWSPPEINYIHYLEHLASFSLNPDTRFRYTSMLQSYLPSWKPLSFRERYSNPPYGYSAPWLALSHEEKESAQVFMLGKLLWCIFERVPSMSSCVTTETFREEPYDILFPKFVRTPQPMRECIRKCTAGAPEWNERWPGVIRRANKIYPIGKTGFRGEPEGTIRETQEAGVEWWREQIRDAEHFLAIRKSQRSMVVLEAGDEDKIAFMVQRPTLHEVLTVIQKLVHVAVN